MRKFSDYLKVISWVNNLGNNQGAGQEANSPVQWLFHCGMLFSSLNKWWGDFKFRHAIHEGIDITYFRTRSGEIKCFNPSTRIPAMDNGKIIHICDDFLGQTIVVEHDISISFNRRILFVYAHIIPETNVKTGILIHKDDIIATVCDTKKNPILPPHLHFSCFEVPSYIPPKDLNWKLFSKNPDIHLIHPVFL